MKRILLIAVAAALCTAGPAVAAPFHGVVVAKQHGVVLVASSQGTVLSVAGSARVGTRVVVNGSKIRAVGRATRASIRGIVVRRSGSVTFLSAAHRILVVRSGRRLASTADTAPQAGAIVNTQVAIGSQGQLTQQSTQQVGQTGQVSIQATVAAVAAGSVTLTVNGQQLVIPLPVGLTLPATLVGTQVTLNVSFANGQPTATGGGDDNDDQSTNDDQGDNNQGDNNQGSTGQTGDNQDSGDGGGDD